MLLFLIIFNFLSTNFFSTIKIYVLLGKQAQTFKPYIGRFNDIIECNHPSYYARTGESMPNIFNEINKLTISKNNYKIKWV